MVIGEHKKRWRGRVLFVYMEINSPSIRKLRNRISAAKSRERKAKLIEWLVKENAILQNGRCPCCNIWKEKNFADIELHCWNYLLTNSSSINHDASHANIDNWLRYLSLDEKIQLREVILPSVVNSIMHLQASLAVSPSVSSETEENSSIGNLDMFYNDLYIKEEKDL